MLRSLPGSDITAIERCSGHGGLRGVLKRNFETAVKVGRPVARQVLRNAKPFFSAECPLPGMHIFQGMEMVAKGEGLSALPIHPIELVARAYRIPGPWFNGEAKLPRSPQYHHAPSAG